MVLQPCEQCRRHIDPRDAMCPFCASAAPAPMPRAVFVSRVSRALVFASATLVSCDQGSPAAKGPEGAPTTKGPEGSTDSKRTTWRVSGVIRDSEGKPLAETRVRLLRGPAELATTTTDANGRYQLEGSEPGSYTLELYYASDNGYRGLDSHELILDVGRDYKEDRTMHLNAPAMPYGAPPARRRIV